MLSFGYTMVPLLTFVFLWIAVYSGSAQKDTSMAGYSLPSMITYYIIGSWVGELCSADRLIWGPNQDIKNGGISLLLARPMSIIAYYFSLDLAVAAPYSLIGVMLYAGFALLFGLHVIFPDSLVMLLLFIMACIMGYLLSSIIALLRASAAFWMQDSFGFDLLVDWGVLIFSGRLVPLAIFPTPLYELSRIMPFQYLVYFPSNIFINRIPIADIQLTLLIESLWLICLYILLQLIWSRGLHRYGNLGGIE